MTSAKPPLSRRAKIPVAILILIIAGTALLASYAFTAPYMLSWLYRVPALVFAVSGFGAAWLCFLWLKGRLHLKRLSWLLIFTLINAMALIGLLASLQ